MNEKTIIYILLSLVLIFNVSSLDLIIDFDDFNNVNWTGNGVGRSDNFAQFYTTLTTYTPAQRLTAGQYPLGMTASNNFNCSFLDIGQNDYYHRLGISNSISNLTGKEFFADYGTTNNNDLVLICWTKQPFRLTNGTTIDFDYFKMSIYDNTNSSALQSTFITNTGSCAGGLVIEDTINYFNINSWCTSGVSGSGIARFDSDTDGWEQEAGIYSNSYDLLNNGMGIINTETPYNYFVFKPYKWYGDDVQVFGDITITNLIFNITDNFLPYINISYNQSACFNTSDDTLKLDLDIDSYDTEKDTIYYSTEVVGLRDYDWEVSYNKNWYGIDLADYNNLYDYWYQKEGQCNISLSNTIENDKHNLVVYNPLQKYALLLNGICSGNKGYYINTFQSLRELQYGSRFYGLEDQERFNVTFYSFEEDKIASIRFERNNSQLYIYDVFDNDKWLVENYTMPNKIHFTLTNVYNETNESTLVMFPFYDDIPYYKVESDNTKYAFYIAVEIDSGTTLYQTNYFYAGNVLDFDWTTTKPTDVNLSSSTTYRLYTTDNIHKGISYTLTEEYISLDLCKYTGGGIITSSDDDVFDLGDDIFGQHLRNYYNSMGTIEQAKSWLWWIFIGLLAFFGYASYKVSRTINFTATLLPASFLCFLMAFFLQSAGQVITFLIFSGLALTPPIVRGFLENGR